MHRNLDLHILRRDSLCEPVGLFAAYWDECRKSLPCDYVVVEGGGTMYALRHRAIIQGDREFISWVNDDDIVLGDPFAEAVAILQQRHDLVGVHLNSYVESGEQRKPMFTHTEWSRAHHIRHPLPVHECNVMRRSSAERALGVVDAILEEYPEAEIEGEQLIYAAAARFGNWHFTPSTFGYVWRKHAYGEHRNTYANRLPYWDRIRLRKKLMGVAP